MRHSLGASRGRIVRQLVTENVALAVAGGTLGLVVAFWGVDLLMAFAPVELPRTGDVGIDVRALAFTAAVAMLAGVVPGLIPALHFPHRNVSSSLREGSRTTETRKSRRTRGVLVVLEFALSVVLLAGAGLMVRSFVKLNQVDPGFDAESVLTFSVYLMAEYPSIEGRNQFFEQLTKRIDALPGVRGVGSTSTLPLSAPSYAPIFNVALPGEFDFFLRPGEGIEPDPEQFQPGTWIMADLNASRPGYFAAAGIPVLQGREFSEADDSGAAPVVIVDERAAQQLWADEDPIGQQIWFGSWRTVIGLAHHTHHHGYGEEGPPQVYFPYAQQGSGRVSMVVKTDVEPRTLIPAIREAVAAIDPLVPIADIRTLDEIVSASVAQRRFTTFLMTAFAAGAVLLAALGIYGVLAFSVGQRRKEIAVRLAIGSTERRVARLVIADGMRLAAIGSVFGLGGALALSNVIQSLLFQVPPNDPVSFAGAGTLIIAIALLACWIPARQATGVDPASVLRSE